MHDKVRSALDAGLVDISTHGDMDSTFGHVTAITPGQAATGIAVPAQDRTNVGVVGSMLSKAVHGLTDVLGLVAPPIATFSKVMGLAQMLGLAKDQDTFGDLGLMGLFGINVTHMSAILSSIIIGVGVDFAVHVRYMKQLLSR